MSARALRSKVRVRHGFHLGLRSCAWLVHGSNLVPVLFLLLLLLMGSSSFSRHQHAGRVDSLRTTDDSSSDGSARLQLLEPVPEPASGDSDDDDEDACPPRANRNRNSNDDDDDEAEKPATWLSLPQKGQLAILTFARLSEPLTQTSLQAYIFYQLKSFDPSLPDSTISAQAGTLQACYTAAQFFLSVFWGRLADTERVGRKRVLLVGLLGTSMSCVGFGFSRSFVMAAFFRTLGGILNSNVGVMRTMIAEMIDDKKYQSRAFLLMPMCYNVGVIIGPIFGGMLADPVGSYPGLFGPGSAIGGKDGVHWMQKYPFALPNILSAIFIFCSMLAVVLGLKETHEVTRYRDDWGLKLGHRIARAFSRNRVPKHYRPLTNHGGDESMYFGSAPSSPTRTRAPERPLPRKRPTFRQTWTRNILLTLLANFLLVIHTSAFNSMTFVFLPTPRAPPESHDGLLHFGGGLGLSSSRVGLATAIIGIIGLPLQIFIYPEVQARMGTLTSFRAFLPCSTIAYFLMPFIVLLPAVAWIVWPAFTFVVAIQVISRTFSLPAGVILVNNCVSNPTVLGTVHGVAQSIVSGARTLGPFIGGWGLAWGLRHNFIVGVWWMFGLEAFLGWLLLWTVREGKGIQKSQDAEEEDE